MTYLGILLTSMDRDGTKDGYDIPMTKAISEAGEIPVIASGGAGTLEHLAEVLEDGQADAVLAASIFHFVIFTVPETKEFKKGTIVIRTAQPLGNVIAYLLEPLSDDGMLKWNFFDKYLVPQWGRGYYPYPVHKVNKKTKIQTINK